MSQVDGEAEGNMGIHGSAARKRISARINNIARGGGKYLQHSGGLKEGECEAGLCDNAIAVVRLERCVCVDRYAEQGGRRLLGRKLCEQLREI